MSDSNKNLPDVIYADEQSELWFTTAEDRTDFPAAISYTRTNLCDELKESIKTLLLYWGNKHISEEAKQSALTKAQGLLR